MYSCGFDVSNLKKCQVDLFVMYNMIKINNPSKMTMFCAYNNFTCSVPSSTLILWSPATTLSSLKFWPSQQWAAVMINFCKMKFIQQSLSIFKQVIIFLKLNSRRLLFYHTSVPTPPPQKWKSMPLYWIETWNQQNKICLYSDVDVYTNDLTRTIISWL